MRIFLIFEWAFDPKSLMTVLVFKGISLDMRMIYIFFRIADFLHNYEHALAGIKF